MKEYNDILDNSHKNNKFYINHVRALEMQREDELREKEDLKIKIMQQAALMQYDDDFDEENEYSMNAKPKYKVETIQPKKKK